MFRLWCEWDIGHEEVIFTSELVAIQWVNDNIYAKDGIAEDIRIYAVETNATTPFEYLEEIGFIGFIKLAVIGG